MASLIVSNHKMNWSGLLLQERPFMWRHFTDPLPGQGGRDPSTDHCQLLRTVIFEEPRRVSLESNGYHVQMFVDSFVLQDGKCCPIATLHYLHPPSGYIG